MKCTFQIAPLAPLLVASSILVTGPFSFASAVDTGGGVATGASFAADLVHRWSFNGDLTDSVGGQTAQFVGSVTTDGVSYKTPGGSSGSAYIDLGDWILPVNDNPITIELWVTSLGNNGWQRIFEFGSMPAGYNFAVWNTAHYSTDSIDMCWNGSCTGGTSGTMESYAVGKEYHLAAVLEKGPSGTWAATFYKQSAETGVTEKKFVTTLDSSRWPGMKQTEMLLGQALTCWDPAGSASYNELRIWNKSMTEEELTACAQIGPDVLPGGTEIRSYTITFNANGGSSTPAAITRDEGSEYGELPTVTRMGYTFDGWYTAVTGGTKATATTKATENATLYAHWTAVKYAITYNLDGGTNASSNPATYTVEDAVTLAEPTRSGYTFSGWTPNDGKIAKGSTGAKTFTAMWTRNEILEVNNDGDREYSVGEDVSWDCNLFVVEASSSVTVSVTGLPDGLGYRTEVDDNEVLVYFTGRAVRAGRYQVLCNATDANGRTASDSIWIEIVEAEDSVFSYVENGDGTITLMQYTGAVIPEELVIPSEYDGKRVTGVGSLSNDNDGVSFFGANIDEGIDIGNVLKSVVLPEGLETIGISSPFAYQSGVISVEFPSTLKYIGDWAFCCCTGLKSVDLSGTVLRKCLWSSFAGCTSLTEVKFPSTLTTLGGISFAWCRALKTVAFAGDAPTIQDSASDGGDRKKWGDWADRIYVDSDFDFQDGATQGANPRYLTEITTYVRPGSTGWGTVPGTWQGCAIAMDESGLDAGNVRFDANGGTCSTVSKAILVGSFYGDLPVAVRNGYSFAGWFSSATGGRMITSASIVPSEATLYAHWIPLPDDSEAVSRLYMVIDLSGGTSASVYPVSYLSAVPANGWTDEYKTTKLVMRRIESQEFGGHLLDKPYFIGVFETTQRQWELVMGNRPSGFSKSSCYAMRPVDSTVYQMLRGGQEGLKWPMSADVDGSSFIGVLRRKTGLEYLDLPTEAQWECACRAGAMSDYNNGRNSGLDELGRYRGNGGGTMCGSDLDATVGTAIVGSYTPNEWGLFDMHGNVSEVCLDYEFGYPADLDLYRDRVVMGGCWSDPANDCRASSKGYMLFSGVFAGTGSPGNRLSCTMGARHVGILRYVQFDENGGSSLYKNGWFVEGTRFDVLPEAERSGYAFLGWFTAAEGGSQVSSFEVGGADVHLFAHWRAIYTITFNSNGGAPTPAPITRMDGEALGALPSVTKNGYDLDGWYTAASGGTKVAATTKVTEGMALYAHWTAVAYSITYNLGGGDNASSNPARYTIEDAVALAAPTRSGYTFTGWTPDGGVIAKGSLGARTFTANWVLASNTYLIEFDAMGGSPAPSSICRAWGAAYGELPTVSYNGYSFDGWYTAPSGGVKVSVDTKVDSGVMLYAHWTRKSGTAEVDLIYANNRDGTLTIQGVKGNSTQTPSLVIPPEKDGRKITCIGDRAFSGRGVESVTFPSTLIKIGNYAFENNRGLKSLTIPDGVTIIGGGAFELCESLSSLSIPASVESIGDYAFYCCHGLRRLTVSARLSEVGIMVFGNCEKLESVELCEGMENVGWGMFSQCDSLTAVVIPSSITNIGKLAFQYCDKLSKVEFSEGVIKISDSAFMRCEALPAIVIPSSVMEVGAHAFDNCANLESAVFCEGVRSIGASAFSGCSSLQSVDIPSTVEQMGSAIFAKCKALKSVSLGQGLPLIGSEMFRECEGLVSICIPSGVVQVADSAFASCVRLEIVTGCEGVRNIADKAFSGCGNLLSFNLSSTLTNIADKAFMDCQRLSSVVVPGSVKRIGEDAYRSCGGMLALEIGNGVEYIGYGAFSHCVGLTSLTIPSSVKHIDAHSFWGCSSIRTMVIHDGLKSMGSYPFGYCESLTEVAFPRSVATLGTATFLGCDKIPKKIYVESGDSERVKGLFANSSTDVSCMTFVETTSEPEHVVFNANGGSTSISAEILLCGAEYGMLPEASRMGYVFDGWYSAAIGDVKVLETTKVMGDAMLYAHWLAVDYAIAYNLEGGVNSASNPATYTIEDEVALAAPTRSGYTFSGWTPNGGKIAKGSTGAKTFTAGWTKNVVTYTISFNANGDSSTPPAITREEGAGYGELPMMTRTGYAFDGWYTAITGGTKVTAKTKATGNVTLYAHWTAVPAGTAFDYVDNWDGTITLMRYTGLSVPEQLVIPSEYDGKKVTGVGLLQLRTPEEWDKYDGMSFFGENEEESIVIGSKLKSVKLSEGIETIGNNSPFGYQSGITSVEFPSTLKNIGDWAFCCCTGLKTADLSSTALEKCLWSSFAGCTSLTDVKFPSTLTTLGGISFAWCRALKSVTFMGNAPVIQGTASDGGDGAKWRDWAGRIYVDSGFDFKSFDTQRTNLKHLTGITTYVKPGSTGWGTVPGNWQGNSIAYMKEDAIPELPPSASADEVRAALEGATDAKLKANITDATVYGQYREWAMKIGAETVKGAANSWISFAVDSAALLEKVPVDSDLKIEEFKPAAAEGAFDFTVSVKDVTVGSGATDANLKKVFGLGGTTQLGVEDFDPDKVALEFGTPVNGKLKFTASPKDKTAKSFFMKMKVK